MSPPAPRSAASPTALVLCAILLAGCGYRPLPMPDLAPFQWQVQREQLPGGSLRVWHCATMAGQARFMVEGGEGGERISPISVYLFEHPSEGLVLIDAGFGRRTATNPMDYPGRATTGLLKLKMPPDGALIDQLGSIGSEPAQVRHMVLTHMHSDHAGGVEDFPDATLWVAREEWQAYKLRPGATGARRQPWARHRDVQQVNFAGSAPYGPFPGHLDVFGDGSMILLPSPGHTPGHMSVLVNLPGTTLLLVGDAAWVDENWQQPLPKGKAVRELWEHDWKRGMGALWRIRQWAERHPEIIVIAGHEQANLERLKAWPEAYR